MTGTTTMYLLRTLHVVVGAFWVGVVVFIAAFLVPSVRAAGPAGGVVMQQLVQVRRLSTWLVGAGVLTLLSGIALYWRDSAGFQSAWLGSGPGRAFGLGGVLGPEAIVVGTAVNSPTARELEAITGRVAAAARPPVPEEIATIQRLQARLARAMIVTAVLLLLASTAMAVARYVP